jgi:hypothetical protein
VHIVAVVVDEPQARHRPPTVAPGRIGGRR